MGAFSSKSAAPKKVEVTAIDRTMLDLKNARDRLQRYRKKLEQDEAKLLVRAAQAKQAGRTETALGLLRLRKFKQQQATDCENQLLNVMQMVETIDSKQNDQQLLAAMAAGKDTLKLMHEQTTVDQVLELMDAIQEEHEVEQEISDILNSAVPQLSVTDEAAVEDELAALQSELEDADQQVDNTTTSLPVAPTHKLPDLPTPETANSMATTQKPERVAVPG